VSDSRILDAVHELGEVLHEFGVPLLVGGSLASITWGEPRFTQDVDVVAHLEERHAGALASRLSGAWYIDAQDVRDAVRLGRSFNVIRLDGMVKIDVFVPRREGHHAAKWDRARAVRLTEDAPREILVTGPEDIVLQKLVWFRTGGNVSEQQWRDVVALLRIQAGRLDDPYLDEWAERLEVGELLERARAAAHA
jgi:hypothetical protein